MRKIPTLYKRDPDHRARVLPEITPGCEWVQAGVGYATRKFDGTCVLNQAGEWWTRREWRHGAPCPLNFREVDFDVVTGKHVGWEPADQSGWWKILKTINPAACPEGTYELCGPRINGNPDGFITHDVIRHGSVILPDVPRTFSGLRDWLLSRPYEGIVFWSAEPWTATEAGEPGQGPSCELAKIKARDF